MPTYYNELDRDLLATDPPSGFPAKSVKISDRYIRDIPSSVSLTSHEPLIRPWTLLGAISSIPSTSIDVASYSEVVIYVYTSGPVAVEANGDTPNAILLPPGSWNTLRTSYQIGSIKIISRIGTGSVYVWGLKGEIE